MGALRGRGRYAKGEQRSTAGWPAGGGGAACLPGRDVAEHSLSHGGAQGSAACAAGHAGAGRTAPGWWLRGSGPGQRLQPGMHWQRSGTRTGWYGSSNRRHAGPLWQHAGAGRRPLRRERPADATCASGPDALCGKGRVEARRRQAQHKKIPPAAKPGGEGWQGGSARYFSISAAGTYSRPKASATPLKVHLP